jgi:hypothetical protein
VKLYLYPVYQTMEPTTQNSEINATFVSSQTTNKHRKKKERGKGREAKFKELKKEEMIGPRN